MISTTGHLHRIESETAHDVFSQRIGKLGVVSLLCFLILNVLLLDDVDLIQRLFMSRNTFYDADMGDNWLVVLQLCCADKAMRHRGLTAIGSTRTCALHSLQEKGLS